MNDPSAAGANQATTEPAVTAADDVIAPLEEFALLRVSGADARAFLHGQLTCDVDGLAAGRATFGGHCTAQGRLLANFLLWREAESCIVLLPRDIAAALLQRLRTYVLRAKVRLDTIDPAPTLLGLAGPSAGRALERAGLSVADPFEMRTAGDARSIGLPGERHLVIEPAGADRSHRDALATVLRPVDAAHWAWLDIVCGVAWITEATREHFVPQMINLDALGGVSFEKGCYPGQEVVARTRYRGKATRRMHLAHVAEGKPRAGDPLYAETLGEQTCGTVVNAARAPGAGQDLLAVLHPDALRGVIRLGAPDGPPLALRALPYAVPA